MNLGKSIRHGTKWLLAGNLAGQILQFAFGVALARLLVPADFGVLVTVQIFTGLAGFVAGGGMGQALIRAREARYRDYQVAFTIQLLLGMLIYAVFFFMAPLFAIWYANAIYTDLLRVSAISFLLRPFSNMPSAWLNREMRFGQRTVINVGSATMGSMLSVALAAKGFGVWSLLYGGIAGSVVGIIALTIITPIRPGLRFDPTIARQLGLYSLKVTSNDLASYVRDQTPNFFLGHLQGPAVVGLFNKADSLAKTPRIIAGSAYDPVFRSLARAQDDKDQSRYIYFRTVMLLSVYMLPFFVGLAWLAEPFISFFYGQKWLPSAEPLTILSIGGVLVCIGYPSGAVLAARNWLGREIFVHLTQIPLFAASCIIGIRWGLSGVAWGVLLSELFSVFFIATLVKRCLDSRYAQLLGSLLPGMFLNLMLCGTLALGRLLLPHGFGDTQPLLYILIMSTIGGLTYVGAFLFIPIPVLKSEALRWKKMFRL